MSVRDTVEIGLNRFARRGYDLDEVSIVPSRPDPPATPTTPRPPGRSTPTASTPR